MCIVVESLASIVSEQFANKVNNRVVGLVTGAVLMVLGVIMLETHYRDPLQTTGNVLEVFCLAMTELSRRRGW